MKPKAEKKLVQQDKPSVEFDILQLEMMNRIQMCERMIEEKEKHITDLKMVLSLTLTALEKHLPSNQE